jgi:hypothetical protein
MMSSWLPLLLLVLCTKPITAAPSFGTRWRCENSCLAPAGLSNRAATLGSNSDVVSWDLQQQHQQERIVSDEVDPPTDESATTTTVWKSIRSSMKRPSFDIVPLAHQRKQQQRKKQPRRQPKAHASPPSGTRFDLRPPSPERIGKWFDPSATSTSSSSSEAVGKKKRTPFNHESVGMTNPVLHISLDNHHPVDFGSAPGVTLAASTTTDATATATTTLVLQDSWIPASSTTRSLSPLVSSSARVLQYKVQGSRDASREAADRAWFPGTNNNDDNNKWRQCRYRRRVGQGEACYERVRDAAVAWQFSHNAEKGILPVQHAVRNNHPIDTNGNDEDCFSLDDQASQNVQPLWSGPHTSASRRLVTYTTTGFRSKWLPKLYTMNPVMVIYDLLDQRYVHSSLFVALQCMASLLTACY